MADSLADLTVSMMAKVSDLQSAINDWGEWTGICQEFDRLYQDIDQQMRSLRSRAVHLAERIRKHESQEVGRG